VEILCITYQGDKSATVVASSSTFAPSFSALEDGSVDIRKKLHDRPIGSELTCLAIPGVCGVPFVDRGVKFVDLCSMAAPRCRTRPTAVYRRYLSAAPPWQRMPATRAGACAFGAGPGLGVPAPARADLLDNLGVRRQAFSGLTGETAMGDPAGSLSHP